MYLKEVVIDGFKSYATRTVVNNFDPSFNAITGLNGSGKSNILDSICFVLGISNLSQVRASSLQELVYKGGLAGVSKATVNLIFDNTDKTTAPVGYEQPDEIIISRQIVIGGRNRYLINGINAQPGRVHNLFHSVGLNVNNPHFLIMQGRITKVINMKPPEVLAMIEEAAGTKMYENKKDGALRTIQKKQVKVDEINSLLEEKINPSLEKLERERKHYLEWNQNNNDLDAMKRYLVAFKYHRATEKLRQGSGRGVELHERMEEIESELTEFENKLKDSKKNLNALITSHAEREDSGTLQWRQHEVDRLGKQLVKLRSTWTNQKAALQNEEKTLSDLQKHLSEQKEKSSSLHDELKKASNDVKPAEERLRKAEEDLEMAETAQLTGASSQDAQGTAAGTGSLIDQLQAARRAIATAQAEIESLKQQEAHVKSEHQEKSSQLSRDRANVRALTGQKQIAEKAVAKAKMDVHEFDFDPTEAGNIDAQLQEETRIVHELRDRLDSLFARLQGCNFRFSDPHPNFDRRKVFNLVARLIRVKDPKMTVPIEVTAGGRLFQVVVDSDKTANDLIKRGQLARRVTFLPLDKIWHELLNRSKVQHAKQIEPATELAIELVDYDPEVTNAIEHVFGKTLICPTPEAAQQVTFDNRVRARSVTMEGDTYDPSGTASGGSSTRQGSSTLALLGELNVLEAKLATHEENMSRLKTESVKLNERRVKHRELQTILEINEEKCRQRERELSETSTGRLMAEVEVLRTTLSEEIPQGLEAAKKTLKSQSEKTKELEELMKNGEQAKKKAQEEAAAAITAVREARDGAARNLQNVKDTVARLRIDVESSEEEAKRLEDEKSSGVQPAVNKLQEEVIKLEDEVARVNKEFSEMEAELKAEQERLASSNQAVVEARRANEELSETREALSLEKAKVASKLKEVERDRGADEKMVEDLERKHKWIEKECGLFGKEGTEYEFEDSKVVETIKSLETMEQRQESLSKRINKKAMHMFEVAKEEYENLMMKKRITEGDKEKIEKVIEGLDEKKMVAVEKTWLKVNEDFGSIFSDLLPGTSAKLEPPEGKTVEDGLEIRVAFGGVWKDSLSELSGGQRSLIALSLILAMLRFKPAPMYILDEVDAALDLSHTQNIGRMLRRHFTGSQFIVVSLKEGMFGNANVIFRTKFVDGVSTVKRTQNASRGSGGRASPLREMQNVEQEESTPSLPDLSISAAGRAARSRKRPAAL